MDFYTDGAYSSTKEKGGWAFYCPELKLRLCGSEKNTTNNRMELTAAIKVLDFIDEANISDKEIHIYSDSKYLVETMLGHYEKKTNLDLWDDIEHWVHLLFNKKIYFHHVKGHADNTENNVADIFANLISQI